jgi:hypothetical protein
MTDPRGAVIAAARELLRTLDSCDWEDVPVSPWELRSALRALDAAAPLADWERQRDTLRADRDRLAAELARLRALVRHLELAHECDECDAIRAALDGAP